ncbi:hypothetical protein [Methylobacterium platani]|uniref:Uncharacterized protein n=2 Tax=Methylobacterium platani TaxID=427683 RepID=A0A179S2E8_9HYPH|nr:hypothetical protein [Methylobacterium platani]KMO11698.1 hypothetical protein SQ03_26310 [Methylobacterium platani JCM 14648]OAS18481.1 hypothetical protein A5481_26335 [Methylobacterium platani]
MIPAAISALLRDRLLQAVGRIAGPDWRRQLDTLNADAIQAYGSGGLLDADAEPVFQAVQERRDRMSAAANRHRAKSRTGQARTGEGRGAVSPVSPVSPVGALALDALAGLAPGRAPLPPDPAPAQGPRAHRAPVSHAERAARQTASRRRAYLGHRLPWPATIKQDFHPAELGAVAVIVREIAAHGSCALPLGTIAARARCCRRTVQTAIRWAAHRGYLAIEERAKGTHVIRIASEAIRQWLAGARVPEPEKSKDRERLEGPAKVATGCRAASDRAGDEHPAETPEPEPAPVSVPDEPRPAQARQPARPSRLDAAIAAWRGVLREQGEAAGGRIPTPPGRVPRLRPG